MSEERGVKELIAKTWKQIDQAEERSRTEPQRERQVGPGACECDRHPKSPALEGGHGKVDEEDLASILSRVPEKYVKIVKKMAKI